MSKNPKPGGGTKSLIPEGIPVFSVTDSIYIANKARHKVKVLTGDVLFLKADGNYTKIFTLIGDYHISTQLGILLLELNEPFIMRVHNTYAINLNKVAEHNSKFVIINRHEIPVSKRYRAELKERLHII